MDPEELSTFCDRIVALVKKGCNPSVYRRGNQYRVHINRYGNYWSDDESPVVALYNAQKKWEEAGCPINKEC